MIINTGARTDIPAFYPLWLINRLREGFVYVRNPHAPGRITKYTLPPAIVDAILFCTKNPKPLIPYLDEVDRFRSYWFVTINAYRRDLEPSVPSAANIVKAFKELSLRYGPHRIAWRYDPIFISEDYSEDYHLWAFEKLARALRGYTDTCVISFIRGYKHAKQNMPTLREIPDALKLRITSNLCQIAAKFGITVKPCAERLDLGTCGADQSGCLNVTVLERAFGFRLRPPSQGYFREECRCIQSHDIGEYNTCVHGCLYCYANTDHAKARMNFSSHDPYSPLLSGTINPTDVILEPRKTSLIDQQTTLF